MTRSRLLPILSALLTVAMVVAVATKLASLDWDSVAALIPASPVFWAVFAAYYLATPLSEWLIYGRLWGMTASGLPALLRKQVMNEIVLPYLGETYFYTWARRQRGLTDDPFAAIKDVSILSALAGTLFTLALVGALWPRFGHALLGLGTRGIALSLGIAMLVPVVLLMARRRVLSLPARTLRWIFAVHVVRSVGRMALLGVLWALVLPQVSLIRWVYLVTLRQVLSRLPLVSNKDLLFAGLTVVLLGSRVDIASAMALTAALLLAAHIAVAAALIAGDALQHVRAKAARRAAFASPSER